MLTNKAIATAVLAALANQAAAFNSHRHLHREVEKRAFETEWVTHWETVVVTAGHLPAPTQDASAKKPAQDNKVEVPAPQPTTTTTTTSVAPVSTAANEAVNSAPQEENAAAAPQPTTLATSVKPAAQSPSPSPETTTQSDSDALVDLNISIPNILNPGNPETTSTTAAPKATATSSAGSSGSPFSGKRGLAYNDATLANLFGLTCGDKCPWGWNWGSSAQGLNDGISYVPMLWGTQSDHTDHWDSDCEDAISAGSKAIFSFNEPDNAGQSNLSPEAAAAGHAQYMNKYSGRVLVGSPSITNSGNAGEGVEWLKSFMTACDAQEDGCAIDFCNVHWYSQAQYADTLFDHLKEAHEACNGKPIWLTEFAPIDSSLDDIADFVKSVVPKLDALDYLHAYSYFMVSADSLMSSLTALSTYGELYASV